MKEHNRKRTFDWIGIYTDKEFRRMGMNVRSITTPGGDDSLNAEMVEKALEMEK